MQKISKTWYIYILIFGIYAFLDCVNIFSSQGFLSQYFTILIAFDLKLSILYVLSAAKSIVNILCLIPIAFFVTNIKFLTPSSWRSFLALRLILELTGHAGEIQFIKSIYQTDMISLISYLALYFLLVFPSYAVLFYLSFPKTDEN